MGAGEIIGQLVQNIAPQLEQMQAQYQNQQPSTNDVMDAVCGAALGQLPQLASQFGARESDMPSEEQMATIRQQMGNIMRSFQINSMTHGANVETPADAPTEIED